MIRAIDLLPLVRLRREPLGFADRFYDDVLPLDRSELISGWSPPSDITEAEDHFTVTVEIPGIDMKALDIAYDDHVLTIKGEKTVEAADDECACCSERFSGAFSRTFRLSGPVNEEKLDATYKDGLLKIVLAKDENSTVKKITVH